MGSFRRPRPRFMSSPVLSDLPRFHAVRQAALLNSNRAWNSVQTAVIKVFQGGGLQDNELFCLNENIRQLLKSELGPFLTDYFQDHLLSKGLSIVEERVQGNEGERLLEALSENWDNFFTEILPTLQAIFYPVQGQELTIRQMALLGFRDRVLLKVNLEHVLHQTHTKVSPAISQMLLVLQGVHEAKGTSEKYLQLEWLVQLLVSPCLSWESGADSINILGQGFGNPRSKIVDFMISPCQVTEPNENTLSPLFEQEGEAYLEKCGSLRRHTVANAPSDLQLFAMTTRMHPVMVEEPSRDDSCLLLPPTLSHRYYSSRPGSVDSQSELIVLSLQESSDLKCTTLA